MQEQGAVGPLDSQRFAARNSEVRFTIAAVACLELLRGCDVIADSEVRAGGALRRPASAPARMSEQGWGVSDPARESHPRPRARLAGSLTPRVSVFEV